MVLDWQKAVLPFTQGLLAVAPGIKTGSAAVGTTNLSQLQGSNQSTLMVPVQVQSPGGPVAVLLTGTTTLLTPKHPAASVAVTV